MGGGGGGAEGLGPYCIAILVVNEALAGEYLSSSVCPSKKETGNIVESGKDIEVAGVAGQSRIQLRFPTTVIDRSNYILITHYGN